MAFAAKSIAPEDLRHALKNWSECHAVITVVAVVALFAGFPVSGFVIALIASFGFLIFRFDARWTASGRFGQANAITLMRLFGVSGLALCAGSASVGFGVFAAFLFALDALDGWVARRMGLSSEFGEFFDKEVDALFLLILGLVLYLGGYVGGWVLIPGLLRYGFVGYLKFFGDDQLKEQRSRLGCWSYFLIMFAMILSFFLRPSIYTPMLLLMTILLCLSFADSLRRLRGPAKFGG